jgi:release factor glutamine methyltransferase
MGISALDLLREQTLLNKSTFCQMVDVEAMIISLTGVDRARLYSDPPLLNKDKIFALLAMIDRRISGVSLAYILEKKGFWNIDLKVNENVLVPRPETETLIELILEQFGNNKLTILDAGTGSGAIALALSHERKRWDVFALDCSSKALSVARENIFNLNLKVKLIRSKWLECISDSAFDLIVSNPPYVDSRDERLKGDGVLFEPLEALVSDNEGLDDLYELIRASRRCLKPKGILYLEHAPEQSKDIRLYMEKYEYTNVKLCKDLNGDDRITFATTN